MRQATPNANANSGNTAPSTFSVFRVPGHRYAPPPSSAASSTNSGIGGSGPPGVPLTVGPSLDYQGSGSGSGQRNSYTSTLPASPPYRESMPNMGLEDYDSMENGGIGWMRTGRIVRVKETGQSYRFPLEDDHLPQLELSRQDIIDLRANMEAQIERAVLNGGVSWMENPTLAPLNQKHSWKVHLEKKNCILYRRKNDSALTRNFLIRCKLECSLNDVMYGVLNDTTEDERTYLAHVHRDDFLDGAVLQLLARPNVEDPFQLFAIKWAAFQSPMDSMFAIRDMLYVEYSRTVVDAKGQKVVARIFQSINARQFHAVERDFGFVRNDISWVQLYRVLPGSNDTKVDLSLSGSVTFPASANTPSWVANRFLSNMYSIVAGVSTAGDAKFICNNQLVTEKPWVPNNERSACCVCLKSFSLLRHRHHCRMCAEIMCTSCTLELSLRTSTLPASLRPEGGLISTEKFCFTCVEQSRREREISQAHELAMASQEQLEQEQVDQEKENLEHTGEAAAYAYHQQQQHSHGGMNGTAWSNKVLTAMTTTTPSSDLIPLNAHASSAAMHRHRTNTADPDRLRLEAAGGDKQLKTTSSLPTVLGGGEGSSRQLEDPSAAAAAVPSSFAKMEESIAAQQMLLRNMLMQGQKMQQQRNYYPPAPPPMETIQSGGGPQIEVLDDDLEASFHMPPTTIEEIS